LVSAAEVVQEAAGRETSHHASGAHAQRHPLNKHGVGINLFLYRARVEDQRVDSTELLPQTQPAAQQKSLLLPGRKQVTKTLRVVLLDFFFFVQESKQIFYVLRPLKLCQNSLLLGFSYVVEHIEVVVVAEIQNVL